MAERTNKLGFANGWGHSVAAAILSVAACSGAAQNPAQKAEATSAARLHQAIEAARHGNGSEALALTNTLLSDHPNYEPALKFQGALFEDMGQPQEAETAFRKALKLAPADSELMSKVGTYDLIHGDTDSAIALFNRRLKVAPHDGDALYYLAQAYHLKGDNDLALKAIQASLKADPRNTSVWQKYGELLCSSGDNEAALRWLSKAQQADPTLDQIDFDLAVASFNNQDLDNALRSATKAALLRPNDKKTLALLATVNVKLAHWNEAEPVFQRLLAIDPQDTRALLGVGQCELELKHDQAAADTLEQLLRADPTMVLAHFYLSRAYAGLGRKADAEHEAALHRRMLEQAASLAPVGDNDRQKATIAQARELLTEGREAEALQLLRSRSAGFDDTPGSAYVLVGALYTYMGKAEDATRCLNKALAIEPRARGAYTYLGILALQQEDLERAETEFNSELAAEPNDGMASAELGEVRYRQGRWSEAADQFIRSKTAMPYFLYMLCDSYFHLGKTQEANLTAELIVDYSKGDPDVLKSVIALLDRNRQSQLAQQLSSKGAS